MPAYEVETENGERYQVETDAQVDDPRALGDMLRQELRGQEARELRQAFPVERTAVEVGKGLIGGVRDAGQAVVDTPASIFNVISEFVSPDAPGGPRRRIIPEVHAPELPDPTGSPETGLERGVRIGSSIATGLAISLLSPTVRSKLSPPVRKALSGLIDLVAPPAKAPRPISFPTGRPVPQMYPKGAVAATRAEIEAAQAARQAAQAAREAQALSDLLEAPVSQAARNIAHRTLDIRMDDLGKMTIEQLQNARRRVFSRLPDVDVEAEGGAVAEILLRIEGQLRQLE